MSTEKNKAALRRIYEELFNKGKLSVVDEVIAADYVFHGPGGAESKGSTTLKEKVTTFLAGFPDLHVTIEDMIAEGDKVAHRITLRGTHTKEFMGIPATGKKITVGITTISRFVEGKEVEAWESPDSISFYQQLGIAPPMSPHGK